MELPTIWIFTHDSIGVGEDGPTHQPVEHLAALRAIPGLFVLRPADANETAEAWRVAMNRRHGPTALVLTRQALATLDRTRYGAASGLARGAYVLADAPGAAPEIILLASGSEVAPCVEAFERLVADGIRARVVSMPSWELFERQETSYRDLVLPPAVRARVAVEAAVMMGWERWVGPEGLTIGMEGFGASAPLKELQKKFGLTAEAITAAARNLLLSASTRGSGRG
jgi:transketolase